MSGEKSAGSVTSQQNPHNDYTAYSNNPVQQSIASNTVTTPTGKLALGEGASSYNREENASYVGTKDGVIRYEGRQTTVGGKFIAGGTVMEGANKPSSETSSEAQQRFKDIKEKGETSLIAAEKLKAATEKIIASRAAALKGVTLRAVDLLKEKVFAKQVVGAESYTAGLKEREASEAQRTHVLNPALVGVNPDISEQEAKIVKERLSGGNYPDYPVFEFQKEAAESVTETKEYDLTQYFNELREFERREKFPSQAEYERQKAFEGFQTESENQLFSLPVIGGGLKWWEQGVKDVQKYFWQQDIGHDFGLPRKDVFASSVSKSVLSLAGGLVTPSNWLTAAKAGGVIAEEIVNEPQQFFKRMETGVNIAYQSEVKAFTTNPKEALGTVFGTALGFYLLSGGKPLDFLKYPKEASRLEAVVREGKPLTVSRGLVIGEESKVVLGVRVKAVKTLLTEKGFVEEPIDATFLGSVTESAGKQARSFIQANKDAVRNQGGGLKVLSVEKVAGSVLQTESEAVATRKGLRVELTGSGSSVFTRVKGAPETMFTSAGEVEGLGVVNVPKSVWRLNVKRFPSVLEKVSVRGKDIPFSLEYTSTSGGGIVEGARSGPDFADVGKGVLDASTGKGKQELFVNARTVNTPVKMVPALQDFINRHPQLLRLSVGAKESFPKALEFIKSKTRVYGKSSTEESVFRLTELGERKVKGGTAEFYSGGGRTYPNEPIAKPLTLRGGRYNLRRDLVVSPERVPIQLKDFDFNNAIKNLKRFRNGKIEFGGYLDKNGNIIQLIKGTKKSVTFVGKTPENAVASFHSHPGGHAFPSAELDSFGNPVGGDILALHGRKVPDFIASRRSLTLYTPREVGYADVGAKNYFLKEYLGKRARYQDLDIQQLSWDIPNKVESRLVEARSLEQVGYGKSYFFGKVKRLVTSKDNFNGGANNRPLSNSGGGASVDVNVGGGSKQVMNLGESASKAGGPRVLAIPSSVDVVQIRAAASRAVSDFYAKQAVRSSALGVASAKAVTGSSTVSRSGFNVSNRSGMTQFTMTGTRTSTQPVTRVSNRSSSLLENKEATRAATRLFNVGATSTRAFTSTGTATESRVDVGTTLRTLNNTATRTATRTATLTRTTALTRVPSITPPPVKPSPVPTGGGGLILPKGDVLSSERKRKRFPSKFFLKSKSRKTGRAPLSDLFNLNITAFAIRGKPHSPSVKTANKFFERSSGLVVPTAEQIAGKLRF